MTAAPAIITPLPGSQAETTVSKPKLQSVPNRSSEHASLTVEIISGPDKGTVRHFPAGILIGVSPRCDLVLTGGPVAWEHVRVEKRYGSWMAVNLNPQYTTRKNGTPIDSSKLEQDDRLTVGQIDLQLSFTDQPTKKTFSLRNNKWMVGAIALVLLLVTVFFIHWKTQPKKETYLQNQFINQRSIWDATYMNQVTSLLLQSRELIQKDFYTEAQTRLHTLLTLDPRNTEAQELLKTLRAKDRIQTTPALDKAREARIRKNVLPFVSAAERCIANNDVPCARKNLEKALALDPHLPDARRIIIGIKAREELARRKIATPAGEEPLIP